MSRELKKLLLGAMVFGGLGGYALTVWGTQGAAAVAAIALLTGLIRGQSNP